MDASAYRPLSAYRRSKYRTRVTFLTFDVIFVRLFMVVNGAVPVQERMIN